MGAATVPSADPGRARRAALIGLLVVAVLAVLGLLWAKWWPYAHRAADIARSDAYPGSSILDTAGAHGSAPSVAGAWDFTVAYVKAIWQALVVALVLSAALQAIVPARRLAAALRDRGPAAGGLAALPGMMCTCCCAPLAATLRRGGASVSAALAFWVGNPLLNPAVLVFLALLAPWQWLGVRVVVGLVVVLLGTTVVARLAGRDAPAVVETAPEPDPPLREAPVRFVRALARLAVTLLPEYLVIVFLLGLFRGWILPLDDGGGLGWVLLAAVAGTLLVIPTAGEVPILLGLAAAGTGAGVIGALLVTLPALSLPSMAMVATAFGARATALMGVAVAVSGLAAAGLLAVLS